MPHGSRPISSAVAALALTIATTLLCSGCVERKLLLRSDPPGARVLLNGVDAGVTPVDVPFQTYGVFDILASAPQCARLRTTADIRPPWWETIPLDFMIENLWPWTVRDDRLVTLTLPPVSGDDADVTRREGELRRRMESGEPLPEGAGQ